mgnify:CR=1 FL=1
MQTHGVKGWGGKVRDRIEAVVGVECIVDAILKFNPNQRQDNPYGRGAKTVAMAGAVGGALLNEARKKVKDTSSEQREAEEELASAEEQETVEQPTIDGTPTPEPEMPDPVDDGEALLDSIDPNEYGGPRDGAGVTGMKNDLSGSAPGESDGVEANAPVQAEVPITRSYFQDNFGMSSAKVTDILIKAERFDALESMQPLIIEERKAIVKYFEGVNPEIVTELPLDDKDYEQLNKNLERLKIPFLQLVKAWTSSDNEEQRQRAQGIWRNRIDKSARLSSRENTVLERCASVMYERGPMNAQTLQSYGVSTPSKEIAKLIKSHGFLFDIITAGQGKRADERGLFYDIDRPDILIKNVGRLVGSLLDTSGELGIGPRGEPRITMQFSSLNAPSYANAVKSEMGVRNVRAEGSSLIIEGEFAVRKALEWAIPSMNEKKQDAIIMKKSLDGDENAQKVLAFNYALPTTQMELMKTWNWSIETFNDILKEVVADGQ